MQKGIKLKKQKIKLKKRIKYPTYFYVYPSNSVYKKRKFWYNLKRYEFVKSWEKIKDEKKFII